MALQFDSAMEDYVNSRSALGLSPGSFPPEWGYESGLWEPLQYPPPGCWNDYSGMSLFSGFAHSQELAQLKGFELSDTAPEFFPPPPGLGAADHVWEPVRVDLSKMASDLAFPPPGLSPPPGLEGLAANKTQAASTPGSLSTAASTPDSLGEDLPSTRSTSSDEGDSLIAKASAPCQLADTTPLVVSETWEQRMRIALRVDVQRDLRIKRDEDGRIFVTWPVDARKLNGKDKQIISSSFDLFPDMVCKLMIKPKPKGLSKGLASFQKARGCGSIELKIVEGEEKAPAFSFRLSIGSGDLLDGPRGPVKHSFASSSVCGLPKEQEDWDFRAATDVDSNIFVVSLEVLA